MCLFSFSYNLNKNYSPFSGFALSFCSLTTPVIDACMTLITDEANGCVYLKLPLKNWTYLKARIINTKEL